MNISGKRDSATLIARNMALLDTHDAERFGALGDDAELLARRLFSREFLVGVKGISR